MLTTLHTTDMQSTVARMTDSFPAERQPTIRQEIAAALAVVFVQMLAPRTGGGRVAAGELLVLGPGARQHIRRNTLHQIHQEITMSRKHGSFTLEETLARLVKAGTLDRAEATLARQSRRGIRAHALNRVRRVPRVPRDDRYLGAAGTRVRQVPGCDRSRQVLRVRQVRRCAPVRRGT